MEFAALREVVRELGVALIAPRGLEGAWRLPGVFREGRDDVAFVGSVVEDAVARFGIDPTHIVVSGFSLGASLSWYVACAEGRRYAGYVPIAGPLWKPLVPACRTPLPEIHHVHGLADTEMPMAGRGMKCDVYQSFAVLREYGACAGDLGPAVAEGGLRCRRQTCAGAAQELCLHDGGHGVEPVWIARAWREIATANGWD